MNSPIVQPSAFTSTKVTITPPKFLDSGAKTSYLNYDTRSLVLQTPTLPSVFGLNVYDKSGPKKYSINLDMRGYQENPKVKSFFNALTSLDNFMIDYAVKNSKLLFKADMKREVIEAFYTPCVKFGRDKEGNVTPYPPSIKLQLKQERDSDDFTCRFYDAASKSDPHAKPLTGIPIEEMLVKKVEVTSLIQCTGVWFAGGKFGLSWKAVQMRLDKVPEGIQGYGFMVDDDDEQGQEQEFTQKKTQASKASTLAASLALDDDEEDEEEVPAPPTMSLPTKSVAQQLEDSDDEEVAAVPVPKKTVVTKKKIVAGVVKK